MLLLRGKKLNKWLFVVSLAHPLAPVVKIENLKPCHVEGYNYLRFYKGYRLLVNEYRA